MSDDKETPESKLDTLLKEWDGKKDNPEMKDVLTRLGKVEEENKTLRETAEASEKASKASAEATAYTDDIAPVIKTLKADVTVSNDRTEEWLNTEGRTNKKLAKAWDKRSEDPEALDKIIETLIPRFKEEIEKEALGILKLKPEDLTPDDDNKNDKNNKNDRALSHASRIARNANQSPTDELDDVEWSGLSGHEFAVQSQKVFAAMRSGALKPE